jgi:hypothetical protein
VSTLLAEARCVDAASREGSVLLPDLPSLEHILIDARGRQHVVLRTNGRALQLTIEGAEVAELPVAISFVVRGFAAIRDAGDRLHTLRRILSAKARLPMAPRWRGTRLSLRNALIALDGRRAGANYREIAVLLYGDEYVERNWRTGLKERVRRDLQRGLLLSAGGYRDLLK